MEKDQDHDQEKCLPSCRRGARRDTGSKAKTAASQTCDIDTKIMILISQKYNTNEIINYIHFIQLKSPEKIDLVRMRQNGHNLWLLIPLSSALNISLCDPLKSASLAPPCL